jgi:NAD(P)-dependent dehydrogenase (short-subunit alcohol dehydrogenase family)
VIQLRLARQKINQPKEHLMNKNNASKDSTGKIAFVTGGSRGLGRNIAMHLAGDGHDVILTYRKEKEEGQAVAGEITKLGLRAVALQLDVGVSNSFDAFRTTMAATLKSEWKRSSFDFLINNAGIDRMSPFAQTTEQAFDELVNVHFKGVYFLTQKLLPLIADGGRIVNTSSGLARFSIPGYAAYASMKGGVEVLTRYLAKELGARKISANVVAPGAIETDFTKAALEHPGVKEMITSQTALGRVGVPDDIGGVVAFLCSEAGRWVNGQRLEASGGIFL